MIGPLGTNFADTLGFFNQKSMISRSAKERNDFALIKEIIRNIDSEASFFNERAKRHKEHMDIHFGFWESINDNVSSISKSISLNENSSVSIGRDTIKYFPYLTIISQQIVEKLTNMGLITQIKDYSKYSRLLKKNLSDQLVKESLKKMVVDPIVKQVTQKYYIENQIQNPTQLNAEQQQQVQADLDKKINTAIFEETQKALEGTSTAIEKIAQTIYKTTILRSQLEYKFEVGHHYAVACGVQAFIPRFMMNEVVWDNVNIVNASYKLSQNSPFFENGIYFHYKEYLTPAELIGSHFNIIKGKTFREIDKMLTPYQSEENRPFVSNGPVEHHIGGSVYGSALAVPVPIQRGVVDFNEFEYKQARTTSDMGTEYDPNLMNYLDSAFKNKGLGVCLEHYYYRWWAPGYSVIRVENGIEKRYVFAETYEKSFDDKVCEKIPIPECWKAKSIGDYIFGIEPVPYQYPYPNNYMEAELGVYGAEMNNVFGNEIENSSLISPAKPYELQFSLLNNTLMDLVNNPLMDVIAVPESVMNGQYGPEGFFDMLYRLQVLVYKDRPTDQYSNDKFVDPASAIKVLQVNKTAQINNLMQLTNYYKGLMIEICRYNSGQLGSIKDYANSDVVKNSQMSVDRGLNHYYSMTAQIRNRVVSAATRFNMFEYLKNDTILDTYFDDFSAEYFRKNPEEVFGSAIHFETPNNIDSKRDFDVFKDMLLRYLSTNGEIAEAGESLNASSLKEAIDISKSAMKRRREAEERSRQHELQMVNAQADAAQKKMDAEWGYRTNIADKGNDVALQKSYLGSIQLLNANDVDKSGQADFIENQDKERDLKWKMHQDKMELERQKAENQNKN